MLQYEDYMLHSGLLLANDSVYGPLFDIGDLIKKIESDPADIVGMTDGTRFSYHLQSYFLYFKKRVITSRRFVDFFRKVRAESYKESIIRKYEIGISRALGRQFELSAIFALERVLSKVNYHKRPRDWINLTVHLWRELILDFHFPFLKKSIAASGAASRDEITKLLAEAGSPYDPALLNL
jgi:rhamnosyltransferase